MNDIERMLGAASKYEQVAFSMVHDAIASRGLFFYPQGVGVKALVNIRDGILTRGESVEIKR